MFKKIAVIFLAVIIMVLPFSFSASAAGSNFDSALLPVTSFTDILGYRHDYFFIFGDSNGLIVEYKYKPVAMTFSLNLTNSDLSYTAISPSGTSYLEIIYRDLYSGRYLDDQYITVTSEYSSSYNYYYNLLSSSSALYPYSFSNFHYYDVSEGFESSFYVNATSFYPGSVVFRQSDSEYFVSTLTEPVFDGSNYFIVFQGANSILMHIYFDTSLIDGTSFSLADFDVSFVVDEDGKYRLRVFNPSQDIAINMYYSLYDLSNGWFLSSSSRFFSDYGYTYVNINADYLSKPRVKCYGFGFENPYSFPVSLPTVLWNFDEFMIQGIISQTMLLYLQLLQINQGLDDVEQVLEDLFGATIGNIDKIYDLLKDIYQSEGETYSEPPTDALNDYLNDESKVYEVLPTGMQENIDTAFDSADVVFTGNGAFALIRGLMQGLVFDIPKISGFVFFALAVGIAVLILGRKVNA